MPEQNRDEIAKLEALYATNPEGRVFTHLAEAYRKAGEFDRARTILEQGLGKHPGYASAYVVLGRVFFDLNDLPQATDSFRRVLELDPHNLVALRTLGDIARAEGRRDDAIAHFQELRHQDPNNAEIEGILDELRNAPVEPPANVAAPVEAQADAEPETVAEPEPVAEAAPEPEMAAETVDAEPEFEEVLSASVADNLPEFDTPAPDYGDLVSPDLDIEWGAEPEAAQETLPGDLADFASMMESGPAEAEAVDEPVMDLSGFDLPEMTLDEPVFAEPAPIFSELAQVFEEPESDFAEATSQPAIPELPAPTAEVQTETMAMLYRDQGLYERSAEIYRALLKERPGDWSLQAGLHEVERLANEQAAATPEAPPAADEPEDTMEPPLSFVPDAPEAAIVSSGEAEEDAASPWLTGTSPATEAPGLYSFTDDTAEEENAGAPIGEYFRGLLGWKPATNGHAPSSFAPAPEVVSEPAVLDLDMPADSAEEPLFEEPVLPNEPAPESKSGSAPTHLPPVIPADELMPWEEPASPSMPDAPVTPALGATEPPPAGSVSENSVDAAFDEWFNSATPTSATPVLDPMPSLSSQPPAPSLPALPLEEPAETGGEDDDDLEMFRSWLQSLKK
jgi:tetratricopeptide (TPR) repeat protein